MAKETSTVVASRLTTTGDLRVFLARIAVATAQGDMELRNAVVAVKACEQINASLYSEAKIAALAFAQGNKDAPKLGQLTLRGDVQETVAKAA